MTEITIQDPDFHGTKTVSSDGRIYIGRVFSDEDVELTVKRVEDATDD